MIGALLPGESRLMKPRRWFRFSLRTIFVVVSVTALGLVQWRRTESLRHSSAEHIRKANIFGRVLPSLAAHVRPRGTNQRLANYWLSMQRYHEHLARKSERMIWQPWVGIEEDPPMPVAPNFAGHRRRLTP